MFNKIYDKWLTTMTTPKSYFSPNILDFYVWYGAPLAMKISQKMYEWILH